MAITLPAMSAGPSIANELGRRRRAAAAAWNLGREVELVYRGRSAVERELGRLKHDRAMPRCGPVDWNGFGYTPI